jgi:hypothetical protein
MVRPSASAALRLMTSSNFVGCSTGRSAGLVPFEDLINIDRRAALPLADIRCIGHQAARLHILCPVVHGWQAVPCRKLHEPGALRREQDVPGHQQHVGMLVLHR